MQRKYSSLYRHLTNKCWRRL